MESLYQELLSRKDPIDLNRSITPSAGEFYALQKTARGWQMKASSEAMMAAALSYLKKNPLALWKEEEIKDIAPFRILYPLSAWPIDREEDVIKKVLELGYNFIIGEGSVEKFADFGLTLVKKIKTAEEIREFCEYNYFLFESSGNFRSRDQLYVDCLLNELSTLEEKLHVDQRVIYKIPKAVSLERLELSVSEKIVFTYDDKDPCFEEALRMSSFSTPFLPLCTFIKGEGLWPLLFDHDMTAALERANKGLIIQIPRLPKQGCLSANLWALGHSLIRRESPSFLIEQWLQEEKPEAFLPRTLRHSVAAIADQLDIFKSAFQETQEEGISKEEAKLLSLKILSDISYYEGKLKNHPWFSEISYFFRDARRIIAYYANSANLNIPIQWSDSDFQKSFFTDTSSKEGGMKQIPKIIIKKSVDKAELDGPRALIYNENSLF